MSRQVEGTCGHGEARTWGWAVPVVYVGAGCAWGVPVASVGLTVEHGGGVVPGRVVWRWRG